MLSGYKKKPSTKVMDKKSKLGRVSIFRIIISKVTDPQSQKAEDSESRIKVSSVVVLICGTVSVSQDLECLT